MRGAILPLFFCKIFGHMRACALTFYDTFVPSDAAWYLSAFGTIPPKLRSQNAAHDPHFLQKSTFFAKKCIFFVKYLVMCIFCCTFAPLFRRRVF